MMSSDFRKHVVELLNKSGGNGNYYAQRDRISIEILLQPLKRNRSAMLDLRPPDHSRHGKLGFC